MYKKQLGFQKIICLMAVILGAIWFVYCLGMITDIYDALRFTMREPKDRRITMVTGSILYYDMQPFITNLQYVSIALILLGCLLFITNTHTRRRYYITNYIATALYCIVTVATVIWTHSKIEIYTWRFKNEVDFPALKEASELFSKNIKYTESTFLLDLHKYVCALAILVVIALVVNAVWKTLLMVNEKKLLKDGKEAV